jgi:NADPH:quinone reductase-like Zn-dependent oxidoreductase
VRVASGDRVLVRGAAGGVGTAAVQPAHALGGKVTALARERHAPLLRELGADEVVDHSGTTPDRIGPFEVVFDTVGTELNRYRGRLDRGGRMVTVALSGPAIAASTVHGGRRIRAFSANPDAAVLDDLAGFVAAGRVRPVVAGAHPLADVVLAHQAFERGGVAVKHVIAVTG